jgi:hypothetical protein
MNFEQSGFNAKQNWNKSISGEKPLFQKKKINKSYNCNFYYSHLLLSSILR